MSDRQLHDWRVRTEGGVRRDSLVAADGVREIGIIIETSDRRGPFYLCRAYGQQPKDSRKSRLEAAWKFYGGSFDAARLDVENTLADFDNPNGVCSNES